jgi:hypothetical protein
VRQAALAAVSRLTGHPLPAAPPAPATLSAPATPVTGSSVHWENFLAPPPPPVPPPPAARPRRAARPAPEPSGNRAGAAAARPQGAPLRKCPVCGEECERRFPACPNCHEKF